jgi:hypothetical protein
VKTTAMRFIIVVFCTACLMASENALASELYQLSMGGIPLKNNERISGFEITISAGRVMSLPLLPMGWNVVIDNDPSWTTSIRGNAPVGAAFLNNRDQNLLENMLTIERLADDLISKEVPFDVTATFQIVNTENNMEQTISATREKLVLRKIFKPQSKP